jgi:hypothetical protein
MDMETAVKEIKDNCKAHTKEINERLADGQTRFAEHTLKIEVLEKNYERMCRKFDLINSRVSQILGAVVTACILLALNLLLGYF